jgi:predicted aspartyl protease
MTPKWLLAVIVPLAIVGTAEARQGPGFDCTKAHHPLARLICNDDDLSQIDLSLNQAYDAYRDTLSPEAKKNLANDENAFIRAVISKCPIPPIGALNEGGADDLPEARRCVAKAYIERTATLRKLAQGASTPATDATTRQQGSLPSQENAVAPAAQTVQLEREHGVFMLPVRINDAVTIPFVLDSGSGDVSVPEDVFKTLLRTRTVTESDFLSAGTYIHADGSKRLEQRFTLHELRVGDYIVKDIVASVAPDKAEPLLGQTFLGKLPGWAIDNTKHTLVIGVGGNGERPQTPTAPASPALVTTPKRIVADDVRNAQSSIGAVLRKNGGGLVTNRSSCPGRNLFDRANDGWEWVETTQVVPINGTSNAVLIDSGMCNGGNGHGQYLVITQNGSSQVVTNAEIADMSFLGRISHVEGTSVFLAGHRWGPDDPHCCPSREAVLEYDIRTGQHKFTLGKRLQ